MTGSFHKQDPVGVPDQGYIYKAKEISSCQSISCDQRDHCQGSMWSQCDNNRETILLIVTAKKAIIRSRFYSISNKVLC